MKKRLPLLLPALLLLLVFIWNVKRESFLGDDCFISFRYAQHLAEGQGLAWNPGERVEGYTNFLWVILMAGAIKAGGSPEIAANALGIASGAGVLVLLLFHSARRHGWGEPFIWLAPLSLAASRSFTAWSTGGLETMFFTLLLVAGYLALLRERESDSPLPLLSSTLLGLAAITRPEGALFAAIAGLFFLGDVLSGKTKLGRAIVWGLPCLVLVGSHLLWRHAYYGEWLPNSFHAKVAGAWWDQGWRYLSLFATDYAIAWFLPLIVVAWILRRSVAIALPVVATAAYLTYVVAVGGDRFEFRFIVVVLPFLYGTLGEGLCALSARLAGRSMALSWVVGGGIGLALLVTTATGSRGEEANGVREQVAGLGTIERYATRRTEEGRFLRELVERGDLPEDLVICVGGAGALPYYSGLTTVDRRGINDRHIARLPLSKRGKLAHERDAPLDYLVEREVAIFDVMNRIVHDEDVTQGGRIPAYKLQGMLLPLEVIEVDGRYLVFVSMLTNERFQRAFGKLDVRPRGSPGPGV
jgi:hypothetical protein